MYWDKQYENNERLWGETPSMLALAAAEYLQKTHGPAERMPGVLDIGCGYGRDALYLAGNIRCTVLGVDISEKAIALAKRDCRDSRIGFRCCGFTELEESKEYDVVFLSNFYQLLKKDERAELRRTIDKVIKPKGLLFLSTLSTRDPEHSGKVTPVPGEINSFVDNVYLHLCERSELEEDFSSFKIKELSEHEYFEPRATGETHHHISWILVGEQEE